MKTETLRKRKDIAILVLGAIFLAAVFSFLFYRQAIMHNEEYLSDVPTQIYISLNNKTYSVLFLFLKWLVETTDGFLYAVGLFEGLLAALSWVCAALYLERHFQFKSYAARLTAFGLLFVTNLYIPFLFPRFYAGSIVSQPWHNIAYMAMRPPAILTMLYFVDLYRDFREQKRIEWKYWILTCLMCFLTTLMKAGFVLVFAPALLIFLGVDLKQKRAELRNACIMAALLLPSVVLLVIQYLFLCSEAEGGIYGITAGLSLFFFNEGKKVFVMKFFAGLLFPGLVYWYNRKSLSFGSVFTAVGYGIALLEAMFLMEAGDYWTNGNFLWGMQVFAFFLFLNAVPMYFRNAQAYLDGTKEFQEERTNRYYFIGGLLLVVLHVICGAGYFYWLLLGNYFYI